MKSIPEIILGKPAVEWKEKDVWMVRILFSGAGGALCAVMLSLIEFLQPRLFIPFIFIYWVTVVYTSILFLILWKALPITRQHRKQTEANHPKPEDKNDPAPEKAKPSWMALVTGWIKAFFVFLLRIITFNRFPKTKP